MKTIGKSLFEQARAYLIERIRKSLVEGELRLPIARQLAVETQVSYGTMRLVLAELEGQGYIRQIQGSGIYIESAAKLLLEEEQIKRLIFFRPPHFGTSDDSYNEWLAENLQRHADLSKKWRMSTVLVSSHEEFFKLAYSMISSADAIAYAPVGEAFSLDHFAKFKALQIKPLVVFNEFPNTSLHNITVDNRRGGAMAASFLLSAHHRKIAILYSEPFIEPCINRVRGFTDALAIAGLEPVFIDCKVKRDDNRYDKAYATMREQLSKGLDVTAVFAVSDYGAWGALDAIKDSGLSIPNDISLIGFDGLPFTKRLKPSLSTIAQPMSEITAKLFQILDGEVNTPSFKIMLSPEIKNGNSVRFLDVSSEHSDANPFKVIDNAKHNSFESIFR